MSVTATPLDAARSDLDQVETIVRGAGTSFYRGMRLLPPDRRHAMYAIYAFCRLVDDIADDDSVPVEERIPRLDAWRSRIANVYGGMADGPVTRVLVEAVHRYGLRQADFLAIIDGMQMDSETPIVAPDLAESIGDGLLEVESATSSEFVLVRRVRTQPPPPQPSLVRPDRMRE